MGPTPLGRARRDSQRLGELEATVMEQLWSAAEPLSVRELVERLASHRKFAYTTILTVVTHLYEKGWVEREKHSRAYLYRPSRGREEAIAQSVRHMVDTSGAPATVLAHLTWLLSDEEFEAMRKARRLMP